ncbi:high osmolarity signaling protein [Acrasis kona]|uniref:High osmolarity signaling protein n=1 Tax=Acrasis kona TaxID=1008807 RepID=A0AAW2Z200_9EUKA
MSTLYPEPRTHYPLPQPHATNQHHQRKEDRITSIIDIIIQDVAIPFTKAAFYSAGIIFTKLAVLDYMYEDQTFFKTLYGSIAGFFKAWRK